MELIEESGKAIGRLTDKVVLTKIQERTKKFDTKLYGLEQLHSLENSSFIIASNHLKPSSKFGESTQLCPDIFVIREVVKKELGIEPGILAKADDGWWGATKLMRLWQSRIQNKFTIGFVNGLGMIPIKKNPGRINREIFEGVETAISNGQPLIIFPEGDWKQDFDPSASLEPGTAHLSRKYQIPILPTYISGAHSWNEGQEVSLRFGEPINPGKMQKNEITEILHSKISELQSMK